MLLASRATYLRHRSKLWAASPLLLGVYGVWFAHYAPPSVRSWFGGLLKRPHLYALLSSWAQPLMQSPGVGWQLPAGVGQLLAGLMIARISPAPCCSIALWPACLGGGLCIAGVLDWRLRRFWAMAGGDQAAAGPGFGTAKAKAE